MVAPKRVAQGGFIVAQKAAHSTVVVGDDRFRQQKNYHALRVDPRRRAAAAQDIELVTPQPGCCSRG